MNVQMIVPSCKLVNALIVTAVQFAVTLVIASMQAKMKIQSWRTFLALETKVIGINDMDFLLYLLFLPGF